MASVVEARRKHNWPQNQEYSLVEAMECVLVSVHIKLVHTEIVRCQVQTMMYMKRYEGCISRDDEQSNMPKFSMSSEIDRHNCGPWAELTGCNFTDKLEPTFRTLA